VRPALLPTRRGGRHERRTGQAGTGDRRPREHGVGRDRYRRTAAETSAGGVGAGAHSPRAGPPRRRSAPGADSRPAGGPVVRRWHRQVHHEKRVARSLAPLESAGWTVLHDRTVAAHRVPHVLVGPPGVVLVYDYLAGSLWRYRARRLGALTHSVVALLLAVPLVALHRRGLPRLSAATTVKKVTPGSDAVRTAGCDRLPSSRCETGPPGAAGRCRRPVGPVHRPRAPRSGPGTAPGQCPPQRTQTGDVATRRDPSPVHRLHVAPVISQLHQVLLLDHELDPDLAHHAAIALGLLQPSPHRAHRHPKIGGRGLHPPRRQGLRPADRQQRRHHTGPDLVRNVTGLQTRFLRHHHGSHPGPRRPSHGPRTANPLLRRRPAKRQ